MRNHALRRTLLTGIGASAVLLPRVAWGGFEIVSQDVIVDAVNNQIHFELVFSEEPDFLATDSSGGQVQTFQYEIDGDWQWGQDQFSIDRIDAVIRGGEIHEQGDLPVRDTRFSDDPDAGGWGRILDSVAIDVDGAQVNFAVSKSLIDDSDGIFQYRVLTTENGVLTSVIESTVVPLPTAVWSGLSLFGGLCVIGGIKRMHSRRSNFHD